MKIRLEEEKDYLKVENLVRDSFWNIYRPGAYEHYIVHMLRDDASFIKSLAYVIEDDSRIIGHINYSTGRISYEGSSEDAVILGPIAIARDCQRQGYGTALINHTLNLAEREGFPLVFVVGDENYYSRFGFESASRHGLYLDGTDMSEENPFFMVRIFDKENVSEDIGIFHIPEVFDVDEGDVDEFDERFDYKEKSVQEGQLGV